MTIQVMMAPGPRQTHLLVTAGRDDVLKAVLPTPAYGHSEGPARLLEGLALWQRERLSVALYADAWERYCAVPGLCDALGLGEQNLHYDVTVCVREGHPRRLRGIRGDFRELRRLGAEVLR